MPHCHCLWAGALVCLLSTLDCKPQRDRDLCDPLWHPEPGGPLPPSWSSTMLAGMVVTVGVSPGPGYPKPLKSVGSSVRRVWEAVVGTETQQESLPPATLAAPGTCVSRGEKFSIAEGVGSATALSHMRCLHLT